MGLQRSTCIDTHELILENPNPFLVAVGNKRRLLLKQLLNNVSYLIRTHPQPKNLTNKPFAETIV